MYVREFKKNGEAQPSDDESTGKGYGKTNYPRKLSNEQLRKLKENGYKVPASPVHCESTSGKLHLWRTRTLRVRGAQGA